MSAASKCARSLASWRRVAPLAIVALTFALALWQLGTDSLWSDEIVTAQLTRRPFGEMWHAIHRDPNHLPMYYTLQWAFSWAGTSEWAIRLPSVFASIATIAAVYWLGCELQGGDAALATAAILATHPYQLWAAQEARYYALVGFGAALSAAGLARLVAQPNRRAVIAFIAGTLIAAYTHFFALLMIAAEGVFSACFLGWRRRHLTPGHKRVLLLAWTAIAVFSLPLIPYVLRLVRFEQGGKSAMLTLAALRGLLLEYGSRSELLASAFVLLSLVGLVTVAKQRQRVALLAALWFLPLLPLARVTSTHFFLIKYLHYLLPMYLALVGTGVAVIARSIVRFAAVPRLAPLAAAAFALVNVSGLASYYQSEKFDWRAATAFLAHQATPQDAVVMLPPAQPEIEWYYLPQAQSHHIIPFGFGPQSLQGLLQAENQAQSTYWLVLIPSGSIPTESSLEDAFEITPFYGVLVLKSHVPALTAAKQILPVFARACGSDGVLAGPAWDTMAAVYERLGQREQAITAYRAALSFFQEPRVRHRLSGDIARLSGDWETALSEYEAAVQPAPDIPEVYIHLAEARLQANDPAGAVAAYLAYWRLSGERPPGLCLQADLLAHLPEAQLTAPDGMVDTPYCRDGMPASCYLAETTFVIPDSGETRNVLFSHPPSAVEFSVSLPDRPAYLVVSPLLDPQSWGWGGDGVVFRVLAEEDSGNTQVLAEKLVTTNDRQWQDWLLPLERGGGKSIRLRLETGPGPAGDYIGDWGGWGKPMVVTLCGNPR
ncbi:MAG: hypothetical protein ACUVWR_04660 [Anaerolineae bacterium]